VADDQKQPIKFDVTIKWKVTQMSLHLPQVVTAINDPVSFDVPVVKMVTHTIGSKPETTIRWHNRTVGFFKTKVPEVVVKMTPIKMDIPEFKMETKHFILKLPVFQMARTHFATKIPEVYVDQINLLLPISQGGNKQKIQNIDAESRQIAKEMQEAIDKELQDFAAEQKRVTGAAIDKEFTDASAAATAFIDKNNQAVEKSVQAGSRFLQSSGSKLTPNDAEELGKGLEALGKQAGEQTNQILEKLNSARNAAKQLEDSTRVDAD
jgi:hypothetical protein